MGAFSRCLLSKVVCKILPPQRTPLSWAHMWVRGGVRNGTQLLKKKKQKNIKSVLPPWIWSLTPIWFGTQWRFTDVSVHISSYWEILASNEESWNDQNTGRKLAWTGFNYPTNKLDTKTVQQQKNKCKLHRWNEVWKQLHMYYHNPISPTQNLL